MGMKQQGDVLLNNFSQLTRKKVKSERNSGRKMRLLVTNIFSQMCQWRFQAFHKELEIWK